MRTVGTNHGGYANERNIIGLPFTRYGVVRCNDVYRIPNYLHFRLRGRMHHTWPFLHWDGGMANYDLLHFFNGVSLGKKPWLSTFETYLPRWTAYGGGNVDRGLRLLAGTPCKRLIALSGCTREIQRQFLEEHRGYSEAIMAKVEVLHPPQALLITQDDLARKAGRQQGRDRIRLMFVGADFFRKGGREVLQAMDVLLHKGCPLQLDIVSAMHHGDYASQATAQDLADAIRIIERHPQAIQLHRGLPNAQVLDMWRNADIGLLPTWADTYGYTVLESAAAGCPVISTDVRALPEINSDAIGWVIPVHKDSWGNALLKTEAERKAFSGRLLDALIGVLEGILADPSSISAKGNSAYQRILNLHDPVSTAARLEAWYDAALEGRGNGN